MRADVMIESDAATMGTGTMVGSSARLGTSAVVDWRTVDRALRAIRQRRAALDAEEARWLREAESLQIWRPLGMVSALDYLERVLGFAPRTAQDRLRVARALGDLPRLTEALAGDELSFSAVRELTRVATPATEAAWVAAAAGRNLRQIEELVADHRPGDRPDDPPDPAARTHVVRFELSGETFARMRQTRSVLDDEHGTNLADDAFVAALCDAVLDGAAVAGASAEYAESAGRARYQIAMTVCARCRQGWQDGAGARVVVDAAAVDRALCDAQHIGSLDRAAPERAYQDIAPSVARFVWRRDGGRCRVDGCRSARGLELHHLVHRADGGSHDALNLILACSACHQAHHAGTLTISGTADRLVVRRPGQPGERSASPAGTASAHVGASEQAAREHRVVDAGELAAKGHRAVDASGAGGGATCIAEADASGAGGDATCIEVAEARSACGDATCIEVAKASGAGGGATCIAEADARGAGGGATCIAEAPAGERGQRAGAGAIAMHREATSRLEAAILRTQAKAALTGMGWKPAIAQAAVAAAAAAQGAGSTLERLIVDALRRCPAPTM